MAQQLVPERAHTLVKVRVVPGASLVLCLLHMSSCITAGAAAAAAVAGHGELPDALVEIAAPATQARKSSA